MPKSLPLFSHFRALKDPRVVGRTTHSLEAILVIAICAVISGANDFQEVAIFAEKRRDWLGRFLDLAKGVPSHDTFERVFAHLDAVAFQGCFARWMNTWHAKLTGKHIAVDGKVARGSARPSKGFQALHLVNVWATEANLCLGVVACDKDSNEITAIPKLLELIELKGAMVSIDAIGCQKKIIEQIVDGGGDYVVVVKENQGNLYEDIKGCFQRAREKNFEGVKHSCYSKEEEGHGREEGRHYVIIEDPEGMSHKEEWKKLNVIGMCYSERKEANGERTFETRYFMGSKYATARYYGKVFRGHWRVENNLHWRMDVVFREDAGRVAQLNAATNFATIRRLALNLVIQEDSEMSVAKKRYAATLDTDYLEEIINV